LRNAACIAVTSEFETQDALKIGIPRNKIRIMPHAENLSIDKSIITPKPANKILAVGRVDPQQNWETLIKSFALVLKQVPDAELILVGPYSYGHTLIDFREDYQQELEELCHKLGVTHKVKFTGRIMGEELRTIYVSSAVFMYIAPYGNYGRTHIEAATYGKPIVSTSVGIVPELVGNDEGGYLVESYDIDQIAQAITNLLSDSALYMAKQAALLKRVNKFLDVRFMVDEYEKLYDEISQSSL
jgi:glycosyltransferase involved in cell wall biosynthesis